MIHNRRILTALAAPILGIAALTGINPATAEPADPPPTTDQATLDAAINCPRTFQHLDEDLVLLVHGTAVTAQEHWGWNYLQDLPATGRDVCTVQLPGRMFVDIQVSAEYIGNAITTLADAHGTDVDVIGHSQGALAPRWVLQFYPEANAVVDDAILLAGPHHGTAVTDAMCATSPCQPATWQMRTTANFIAALNTGRDETPGDVDYTSIYSETDELVQPASTAVLDGAVNVSIQDHCPGKAVHHAGLNSDPVTWKLVLSALDDDGPADPSVIGPSDCLDPWYPGMTAADFLGGNVLLYGNGGQGLMDAETVSEEPALREYAR